MIRIARLFMLASLWFSFLAGPAHAQAGGAPHMQASLAFATLAPAPGGKVALAIEMRPEKGWHAYWSNPGTSGLPVEARWTLPEGASVSKLREPAPQLLDIQGIASYVHEGPFALLGTLSVPASAKMGSSLPVRVDLNWLTCSATLCVPERKTLTATLTIGNGAPDQAGTRAIAAARQALPRARNGGMFDRKGADWIFALPAVPQPAGANITLFPKEDGWFAPGAPQHLAVTDKGAAIRIKAEGEKPAKVFRGVLRIGSASYDLSLPQGRLAVASQSQQPGSSEKSSPQSAEQGILANETAPTPETIGTTVLPDFTAVETVQPAKTGGIAMIALALAGAFAGGLLLNLMPCVFPILSLKALSIAKSGGDPAQARREGLGYTFGTMGAALLLGASLIALRALGVEVGWSFQLQSPMMILFLLLLTGAIALNLAGLYDIPAPRLGGNGSAAGGWSGGIATGALAAIVAMPCSGPFMAGALGAALVLPSIAALAVFAMLGLGMAMPFLLIAFVPAMHRRLPKPGAWMNTLRRLLALPMFATALALAWLLGRQTGVDGMATGLAVMAIFSVCLWWFGLRQQAMRPAWIALIPGVITLASLMIAGLPQAAQPAFAATSANQPNKEAFSVQRLAQLRAARVPVFLDFTADWCLSCKVNERIAIDTEQTRRAFRKAGVVTMIGDWTREDPEITRFLAAHGRNSIPFYLFYAPGQNGEILPQILTPALLSEKAENAARMAGKQAGTAQPG